MKLDLQQIQFIFTQDTFILDEVQIYDKESIQSYIDSYHQDRYQYLYHLGFANQKGLSLSASFLQLLSESFIDSLLHCSELEIARENIVVEADEDTVEKILRSVPFVIGSEYINEAWIKLMYMRLQEVFAKEISSYQGSVQMYIAEKTQNLQVAQRIFFHLVDYEEANYPFAFMATYATKDEKGHIRHKPLEHALKEYKNDRKQLITLLSCLNKAAKISPVIGGFMESGEMFHPIKLTIKEAYSFLQTVPEIENCGIKCRVPNWWKKKYSSIHLDIKIGDKEPSLLGFDSILSMTPKLMVNGVALTQAEVKAMLKEEEGLIWMKGQWVEIKHDKLKQLLEQMKNYKGTMNLREALQVQLDASDKDPDGDVLINNGKWLANLLHNLRQPTNLKNIKMPKYFHATLREYQKSGYTWLNYMGKLGFGACLADDMGLGKTVQVLAYLESMREKQPNAKVLLVVPASLLGNWEKEIQKFADHIDYHIYHGASAKVLNEALHQTISFLNITTYNMVSRIENLQKVNWDCVILDEAQAIKNPLTKQTKTIKQLQTSMRIAMTGTPIENDLINLWSLFDFLNKGLLGTFKEFQNYTKSMSEELDRNGKLKNMVSPFILRRLKTDKSIISDLPEKLEEIKYVNLSKRQSVLYHQVLADVEEKLQESEGMERRGLILSTLTKLKQICNHPDQFTHDINYLPKESGKFELLKDLCETIFEKRERVLVFTQYKEICDYLDDYLATIFKRRGFVIHGGTSAKKRTEIVDKFNSETYYPYIVCSVKAAGTGLNLTAANHVIHFDRWWNPAVENQASDRAYRIGQKKNVFIHKLVCKGTVEEKIDALINSKKELAESIITAGKASWITELGDAELMNILRLDEGVSK